MDVSPAPLDAPKSSSPPVRATPAAAQPSTHCSLHHTQSPQDLQSSEAAGEQRRRTAGCEALATASSVRVWTASARTSCHRTASASIALPKPLPGELKEVQDAVRCTNNMVGPDAAA
ncbi:hypothetical protein EON66_00450 [archaeon]|nr:MAG: hypothetical protein EON66_00450 [archaeon]